MNYILVVFMVNFPPEQIGPFNNVFACELAADQIKIVRPKTASVCVDLNRSEDQGLLRQGLRQAPGTEGGAVVVRQRLRRL
jgi:hypothetical protein